MNPLAELVGESPGIVAVRETIARLLSRQSDARRLAPILIQGETGTGKGLVARALHQHGPRADGPFVDVNCAAIPETLLEAEMFGFERGAFTDARQAKRGLFQAAHRGTIFLDEVGLMPEGLQGKFLKAIEERVVRRLGSTRNEPVDTWVLTATSTDLAAAARQRRFREDLYHRLAVVTLWLPPLRDRDADILVLADRFLARACADYDLPPKTLTAEARAVLRAYPWPGNVRELINVMERVALLTEERDVTPEELGLTMPARPERRPTAPAPLVPLEDAVGTVERTHLLEALRQTNWNISRAATRLGIPRNTLRYRIEKHGLKPEAPGAPPRVASSAPSEAAPPPAPTPLAPEPTPVTVVRWERRRLALLRVALRAAADGPESADPSRALGVVAEKIQAFGGRVVEMGTSGIVAAFGLEPIEDAPRRAVHAAMAIQMSAQRDWNGKAAGITANGGIHAGQFMVARLGDAIEIDQDAKRPAWALLESLVTGAEAGAIVVSEGAAPFLQRRFELLPMPWAESAERIYRLGRPEGSGFERQRSRFVGRRHELELLHGVFASALRGQGQVVGIVGEAGIGKSRLLFEFRQSLGGEPVTYLEGHCASYGSTTPYLPVLDLLRHSCGITDADTPDTVQARVRAALAELGLAPDAEAPYLLHLLGVKEGTSGLEPLSPELVTARTFETLRQMSLRGSRRRPIILAVEDLHWIDRTSEEYLASLVESFAGAPILFVATYRPGYRPPWIEKSYATQLALPPLAPEPSLSVVRSVLDPDDPAESLVRVILAKAEGNPFFLEELARAVREHADLAATGAVPDTIEAVISARIDRLAAEDKQLLQAAAVVGKDVPLAIIEMITELPAEAVRKSLGQLKAAEFLYETRSGPEVEYTFKHALTHEVAYASLLPERRRGLHARILHGIETLHAARLGEQVERLAHHAFRAETWEKAVGYARQAGTRALARSAHREAAAWFEQSLAALGRLPESRERLEQAIDLRLNVRTALLPLGEFGRIFEHLGAAESLAKRLDDPQRLGRVCAYLNDYFRQVGDYERAIESGQRGLAIAEARGDLPLRVATHIYLAHAYHNLGQYRSGADLLRRNVELLEGELSRERLDLPYVAAVHSRTWLVWCLAELGEFAEAITRAEESLRIAETADHPSSLISAHSGLGHVFLRRGELERAIPVLERGLELSRAWKIRLWFAQFADDLGSAYALSGRISEALPLVQQAIELHAATRGTASQSLRLVSLGQAYVLAGRVDEARELSERALMLARSHHERANEAYALRLCAEVAAQQLPAGADSAARLYQESLVLAEELGMRPLVARCHLGLGQLYRRAGREVDAFKARATAVNLLRELGMRYWQQQLEAELTASG